MLQLLISAVCGAIVGFAFGLTGVGSVFAVPLLVYVLGLEPHRAVCVSMFVISGFALVGTLIRVKRRQIDYSAGVFLAGTGILGAPMGAWVGRSLSGEKLLLVFAFFVMMTGLKMLMGHRTSVKERVKVEPPPWYRNTALLGVGFGTGFLGGLLGIGGGFLIVPSMVFFGRMEIHRAIATSLPVIFLIGVSAVAAHLEAGQTLPPELAASFLGTGLMGMIAGISVEKRLSDRLLQRIFGVALVVVSVLLLNLGWRRG